MGWLLSESPITTSGDSSYLQLSKSKRVQGHWGMRHWRRERHRPTNPLNAAVVSECRSLLELLSVAVKNYNQFRQCRTEERSTTTHGARAVSGSLFSAAIECQHEGPNCVCSNAHLRRWKMLFQKEQENLFVQLSLNIFSAFCLKHKQLQHFLNNFSG